MTLGELKVACIKLMFDNDSIDVDPSNISNNAEYTMRTVNIVESINRALFRVANVGKLPKKTFTLDNTIQKDEKYIRRYNLDTIKIDGFDNDCLYVEGIVYQNVYKYTPNVDIIIEGNNTLVLPAIDEGKYIITYSPNHRSIPIYEDDETKLDIPDYILNIVPFYVKGDLFEDDDAEVAIMATNKFERYLSELNIGSENRQAYIQNAYKIR